MGRCTPRVSPVRLAVLLLSLATTGLADTSPIRGYGRYPCTDIAADGSFSPSESSAYLTPEGTRQMR